ncbi:uncharacterized protein METZ01_LOCUS262927 [marine metagenome]|uniref:Uncharacterized protein n=1 Tax=marine metagenome TaxID=408172 RepID=A0A382JFZ0_9ZZZZ
MNLSVFIDDLAGKEFFKIAISILAFVNNVLSI